MEKPVRPYKNIDDFRAQLHWCGAPEKDQWPCLRCRGSQTDLHRKAFVECPDCKGTGNGTRKAVLQEYRKAIAYYEIKRQKWNQLQAARKTALRKLTKEEIEALRKLGI